MSMHPDPLQLVNPDGPIIEGIVTSQAGLGGSLNIAPMGPVYIESARQLRFRPFQTSQTFQNLMAHPEGVFHVTDDVLLFARAALGGLVSQPPVVTAQQVAGCVLADCCHWMEFQIIEANTSEDRAEMVAQIVHTGTFRNFFGFHRARHAVLEATILATRVHLIPADVLLAQLDALRIPVEKTAGANEVDAFQLVDTYIRQNLLSSGAG